MNRDTPFAEFAAGVTILAEGEPARAMYIIESGRVEVRLGGVLLGALGPGEVFGEMALLQEQPHSASVEAKTAVRALCIGQASFHAVLRENPEIAVRLMRQLVLRLRAGEDRRLELERRLQGAAPQSAAPAPAAAAEPAAAPALAAAAEPAAAPASSAVAQSALSPPPAAAATRSSGFAVRHAQGAIPLHGDRGEWLVGRPDPATGQVPEIDLGSLDATRSLSRRHARLRAEAGRIMLREEPGVANGTWVNGERLQAGTAVALAPGDRLRFGAVEVEFAAL